ncbi:hypothetical protein OU798_00490 [Prolixibacteraceae bacterium Z1-6]|uniref:Lipocalin-like domain-containing protein n=1 Tax=Draconibacterium aestuarii TaxID=2998507 RepID=A0A9X3J3Y8_9BACT|nr:hypothetical protein [Prolixibacteraceae bacterium Z1-6]
MKKLLLLIIPSIILISCQNKDEQMLTAYSWEIQKVVDFKSGTINQTDKGNKKTWDFSSGNRYYYKTKAESIENLIEGEWQLNNHTLLIFNEFDSTVVHIEKIDSEEMVWLIPGNDSIRLYLNSKAKDMVVPNFPNMNKE